MILVEIPMHDVASIHFKDGLIRHPVPEALHIANGRKMQGGEQDVVVVRLKGGAIWQPSWGTLIEWPSDDSAPQ